MEESIDVATAASHTNNTLPCHLPTCPMLSSTQWTNVANLSHCHCCCRCCYNAWVKIIGFDLGSFTLKLCYRYVDWTTATILSVNNPVSVAVGLNVLVTVDRIYWSLSQIQFTKRLFKNCQSIELLPLRHRLESVLVMELEGTKWQFHHNTAGISESI